MGLIIAFEGNIGASKSTQCKLFARRHGFKYYEEPADSDPGFQDYLKLYYSDQRRYALEFQYYALSLRDKMEIEAMEHVKETAQAVCLDRTRRGDAVFAHVNHEQRNISEIGYRAYLALSERMRTSVERGMVFVYLDASPEVCFERIQHRARATEVNCDPDFWLPYLRKLEARYKEEMSRAQDEGRTVIMVDSSNGDPEEISDRIETALHEADPRWDIFWYGWEARRAREARKQPVRSF